MNARLDKAQRGSKVDEVSRALQVTLDFVDNVLPYDLMQELHKKVSKEAPNFVLQTK